MTFEEWIAEGIRQGFVMQGGFTFCAQHDSVPYSAGEMTEMEAAGWDADAVCVPVLRLQP